MSSTHKAILASLLIAAGGWGCQQKTEAPDEVAQAGAPGRATTPTPAPKQRARVIKKGQEAGEASAPSSQPAAPAGQPAPPTHGQPAAPGGLLSGRVLLDPAMASQLPLGGVLFIMVRQEGSGGQHGNLVAAQKHPIDSAGAFPLAFQLTPRDVLAPGRVLSGALTVEARVDGDGDAISKKPGDIAGAAPAAVPAGSADVQITLNRRL